VKLPNLLTASGEFLTAIDDNSPRAEATVESKMSLQDFKQQHPDLYREVHAKGARCERDRQHRIRREAEVRAIAEVWWAEKMRRGEC
jgi:predicted thioredoxin/glutaredoxin